MSDLLDSKRQKNKDIFMDLERCLKEQGLTWTWEQIRTCWKNLKKRFTAERLLLCKSGGEPSKWKWLDKMSLLLGDHPMVLARDYGVDTTAEDEDIVLVSQDTNTTIKYSWCKLRKNTKTAIAVAERQLRKEPQPTAARAQAWRSGNRYRKTGFQLASTQSVAAITAHLNSSVRVQINSGASTYAEPGTQLSPPPSRPCTRAFTASEVLSQNLPLRPLDRELMTRPPNYLG
ncbi:hypothetical protein HPB51_018855 [Rhipicephalus microplus]|uniref:Myb/SANT-like DNA-binding domain-containing protein n=1 Tax=Rhipicephalus microplus TaxID=6941 RepID=A0A9J6DPR5_RHIMP|nr:hypothetical protein HPB51_018855 [Rhipicephalus microplus]